jgi:hypothetical protein
MAGSASRGPPIIGGDDLEHFQEKWNPVFRPKMRQRKMLERFLLSLKQKPL